MGFLGGSEVKASASNVGDQGSIPGSGRSPGERNGYPLQYSCLENTMYRGSWQATVHGVAKSWTQLSDFTSLHFIIRNTSYTVTQKYSFNTSLFLVVLNHHCSWEGFLWLCGSGLFVVMAQLLTAVTSLVATKRLQGT